MKLVWLAAGGVLGTLSRFFLSHLIQQPLHRHLFGFPAGILAVNLLGCFLLGIFVSGADRWGWGDNARVFAMAGFCGAFTTFSTLVADSAGLWKGGSVSASLVNVALSLVFGFAAFAAGALAARAV